MNSRLRVLREGEIHIWGEFFIFFVCFGGFSVGGFGILGGIPLEIAGINTGGIYRIGAR